MYTLYKFHFLNGISEINQLFDDIQILLTSTCISSSTLMYTPTYQDHPEAPEVTGLVISRAVEELRCGILQGEARGLQGRTAAPRWKQPCKSKINHLQHRVIRLICKQHVLSEEMKKRGTIRDLQLCIDNKPQEDLRYNDLTFWHC